MKRILSIIAVVAMTLSFPVFARAEGNVLTVDDAAAYCENNLSDGYLYFTAGVTYAFSAKALDDLYFDDKVKYYVFKTGDVTVTADKNAFYDFDVAGMRVLLTGKAFYVTYLYKDGAEKPQTTAKLAIRYSVPSAAGDTLTGKFAGGFAKAISNDGGMLTFETDMLGAFSVSGFEFADVTDRAAWYYTYVNAAGAYGVLDGMDGKNFAPRKGVTRAQLAAMIVKATRDVVSWRIDPSLSFSDVPEGKWYHDYIMQCASLGVVNGVGDGKFNPDAGATRQEVATVIARLLRLVGRYGASPLPAEAGEAADAELAARYADGAAIYNFAKEPVLLLHKLAIMTGDGGSFRPKSGTTRAECAKIFYLISVEMSKIK